MSLAISEVLELCHVVRIAAVCVLFQSGFFSKLLNVLFCFLVVNVNVCGLLVGLAANHWVELET